MTALERTGSEAVTIAVRPRVSGNPLDLTSNPSLPKPRGSIEIVEMGAGLTLVDRKLINVLLALSWDKLADPKASLPPFTASTAELRRAIGEPGERDNERLRQSFDRLMATQVRFPYEADGELKDAAVPLLSFRAIPKGSGRVHWEFPGKLRPMLAEPGIWARIHLEVCARFGSKYSLLLYELLSVRANRRVPTWDVQLEDLRTLLSLAPGKLENFRHFERRVLEPAVREVNEFSGLAVEYGARRSAARGRRVESIVFAIAKKSTAELADVARLSEFARDPIGRVTSAARDTKTPDLQDDQTDEERGGPAQTPAAVLAARVSDQVLEELRTRFPGADLEHLIQQWSGWAAAQRDPCRAPSTAFRRFVEKKLHLTDMPAPQGLSQSPQLSPLQHRAVDWLKHQDLIVRKRWYERAVNRDPTIGNLRAATARDNLHHWIGAIIEEMRAEGCI